MLDRVLSIRSLLPRLDEFAAFQFRVQDESKLSVSQRVQSRSIVECSCALLRN